jgi:uncharacterized protein
MTEQKLDISGQIDRLIKLQQVDSVIYQLKAELEQKPVLIETLKQQTEQEKKDFQSKKDSLKHFQVKRKEREVDLESKENEIKKLNIQLYQLKTNKEYEAMQLQINGLKADCSVLEEEIIKLMDEIEKQEQDSANEQKQLEQKQKESDLHIKKIEEEIKMIEQNLASEQEKRKAIALEIDKKILHKYEKILEAKDGLAITPVLNDACGGCYMQLPPQVINEIRLKNDIICCQLCLRILYDKGE